jgi:FAD/FMN-containing dehydrogenase
MPLDTPARSRVGDGALAQRLRRELKGEVLFDAFSRGRYSTDASIYQVEPLGVVVPRDREDAAAPRNAARRWARRSSSIAAGI